MQTENELKSESENSLLPFKITYAIVFAVMIIVDLIFFILILTRWASLEFIIAFFRDATFYEIPSYLSDALVFQLMLFLLTLFYYIVIITPIIKIAIEVYEISRYINFLVSKDETKENAIQIVRGTLGTRIFRIFYLIVICLLLIAMESFQTIMRFPPIVAPGEGDFLQFYFRFTPILIIHMLLIILGPHIIKFTIDYENKNYMKKMIVYSIIASIVLIFVILIDVILPSIILTLPSL